MNEFVLAYGAMLILASPFNNQTDCLHPESFNEDQKPVILIVDGDPHGADPHGDDPHDEQHDAGLPANAAKLPANAVKLPAKQDVDLLDNYYKPAKDSDKQRVSSSRQADD